MRIGNITPSDLDGYIEYKNKAYLLIELKYGDAEMKYGQRLALERMARDLACKKEVLAMIVEHDVVDVNATIPVDRCEVREIFTTMDDDMRWRAPVKKVNALSVLNEFKKYVDGKADI
jgi:hypothetical protein